MEHGPWKKVLLGFGGNPDHAVRVSLWVMVRWEHFTGYLLPGVCSTIIISICLGKYSIQCFDTVGWATGRTSDL